MGDARKLPVVAIVLAGASFVVAIVAVGIIVTRDPAPTTTPVAGGSSSAGAGSGSAAAAPPGITTIDAEVDAKDMFTTLKAGTFEGSGLRIDGAAAKTFGLEAGDVITAVSGSELTASRTLDSLLLDLAMTDAKTIYLEVTRAKGGSALVRLRVSGNLRRAYFDADLTIPRPQLGSNDPNDPFASPFPPPPPPPPPPDPGSVAAGITTVDETHATITEAAVEKLLMNPMDVAKGARVVPAMKNGQPEGIKMYAIRPSSVFARLNVRNGDTILSINGHALTSMDKALEIYTQLRDAKKLEIAILRRGTPMTLNIDIVK